MDSELKFQIKNGFLMVLLRPKPIFVRKKNDFKIKIELIQ